MGDGRRTRKEDTSGRQFLDRVRKIACPGRPPYYYTVSLSLSLVTSLFIAYLLAIFYFFFVWLLYLLS